MQLIFLKLIFQLSKNQEEKQKEKNEKTPKEIHKAFQ